MGKVKQENKKKIEPIVEGKNEELEQEVIQEEEITLIEKIEQENSIQQEEIQEENTSRIEQEEIEESIQENQEEAPKKDWLQKYAIAIAVISVLLLIGIGIFSTVFGLSNRNSNTIVAGVSIKGMDLSGLTKQLALEKIQGIYHTKVTQNIMLQHGEYETSLTPEQVEANFGIEQAVDMAYSIGRSGKVLKDNYAIINASLNHVDITPSFNYNEKALTDFVGGISAKLPDAVKQSSYSIEENELIVSKGKAGVIVKEEELSKEIVQNMIALKAETEKIQIPVEPKNPDPIDLEKIRNEIYKEPQDAYYSKDPFIIHPHANGVDFTISVEEATNALKAAEEEITIPLKITKPKKTTNQIGTEAFPDLLASYSTTFATSNSNRSTNIRLSSNKINGVVLMPGQQFSYNQIVGKRTVEAGYKEAAVYVGGKVENGIGGGICQVSSTLYNTVLRSNLEIVKRYNHRFSTGYVPLSTDATVSWGGPDFIFKNSRKYPIKVVSTVSGGKITINIYGCKEEVEYDVQIKSETLQTIPTKTVYKTNASLPKGTQKTIQKGHGGYKSRAYRILSLDGKVVSKQLLSNDTYAILETIIEKN